MPKTPPTLDRRAVANLWLERQGFTGPRGTTRLTKRTLVDHLERTGALQLDSVNVVDRAHYLTLWSRFGPYDRRHLDRWVYRDRAGYEYWGHEASILPISHLPLGRRRMRRFPPPSWRNQAWWSRYHTSPASRRRVLSRLRSEGPLESNDFDWRDGEPRKAPGKNWPLMKEDKRSLKLLWHKGRVAVATRRHFRCVYDLAERIYPDSEVATTATYHDSWLLTGLSGCGVASEAHLVNYLTAPNLSADERRRAISRNLRNARVVEARVEGLRGRYFVLPEHLERIDQVPLPTGTTLVCPFDSLLWQRKRALDLLDFEYRIEIYVPEAKRRFGYYVLPILHDGRLVGRVDPKLHRDRSELELKSIHLEPGFSRARNFDRELGDAITSLGQFLGIEQVSLPKGWRRLI